MSSQLLYLENPLKLEFEATVCQKRVLPDGRIGVVLDRTCFYPTGGGQEHDTGVIGEAQVVDVFVEKDCPAGSGDPVVIHVLDRDIEPGEIVARVDPERRLRHMQHHTAQHLLTQCFVQLLGLDTLSANINGYNPSTIDIPATEVRKSDLYRVEDRANEIIYEDRLVKSYFVAPDQLSKIPLRRPPKVSQNIRIVEIDAFDYSACGGTHCLRTGMIGVLKILKTERQNEKTRIYFVAGIQAMQYFREYQDIVIGLAGQMSVHPQELIQAVQRQADQLKSAQKELQAIRLEKIALEARTLAQAGERFGSCCLILGAFENRPVIELRALADEFKKMPGIIALLGAYDDQKVALIAVCSEDTGLQARQLLNKQLSQIGGKGGGDQKIAQGGGYATLDRFKTLFDDTRIYVKEQLS